MKKAKLKSIEPISCGKIFGGVYLVLGAIAGIFLSFVVFFAVAATGVAAGGGGIMVFVAILAALAALIGIPVFYGAMGFVFGIISAAIYNLAASYLGGIEFEIN